MLCRDRAIACNDKRHQDSIYICSLTYELVQLLLDKEALVADRLLNLLSPILFPPPGGLNQKGVPTTSKAKDYGPTWERDTRERLSCIEKELSRSEDNRPSPPRVRRKHLPDQDKPKALLAIDIGPVSRNRFQFDTCQEGAEVFSITLDGLDHMIENKR
jgi:hypothetical protein